MSVNKGLPTNPSVGLGPISPSAAAIAANRAARLEYLSPYPKPGAPHWYTPANFGAPPPGAAFSPLYPCPPSAIMSHLSRGPTASNNVPPHIAAAAAESSLNRLRTAAAAVAGASLSGSSTDNIAAISKTITSIGERTLSATNGSKSWQLWSQFWKDLKNSFKQIYSLASHSRYGSDYNCTEILYIITEPTLQTNCGSHYVMSDQLLTNYSFKPKNISNWMPVLLFSIIVYKACIWIQTIVANMNSISKELHWNKPNLQSLNPCDGKRELNYNNYN